MLNNNNDNINFIVKKVLYCIVLDDILTLIDSLLRIEQELVDAVYLNIEVIIHAFNVTVIHPLNVYCIEINCSSYEGKRNECANY